MGQLLPALQLYAHVGTTFSDGAMQANQAAFPDPDPGAAQVVQVTEVRVLHDGWLELVRFVGLERAAMLLVIAQLSVVRDGQLVCTATNEEIGTLLGVSRQSVGRILGSTRSPAADSLLGRQLARVEHNVSASGMRSAGRQLWLHRGLYRWVGDDSPSGLTARPSVARPTPVRSDPGPASVGAPGVRTSDPRTTGTPTYGATCDDAPTPPSGEVAHGGDPSVGPTGTFGGDGDDGLSQEGRVADTREARAAVIAVLTRWGFNGSDDAIDRHGLEIVTRTVEFVAAQDHVRCPAAYVQRLLQQGGPSPAADELQPRRPGPEPVPDGPPLYAPGRPQGPTVPAVPETHGEAHGDAADVPAGTQQAPSAAEDRPDRPDRQPAHGGPASGQDPAAAHHPAPAGTPHAPDRERPGWPPATLDRETVEAVEAEVDATLAPNLPRRGPMFEALCRQTARQWSLLT